MRRDFTVNALYKKTWRTGDIADPLGKGFLHDLSLASIECVPQGLNICTDDPLRILRGLRFVSTLPDFKLSKESALRK